MEPYRLPLDLCGDKGHAHTHLYTRRA